MDRQLVLLTMKQIVRFWRDQWWVVRLNYRHKRFLFAWFWLRISYLFDSPYWVSRRYQRKHGASDLHVYGETPLPIMAKIAGRSGISAGNSVFELGAGSGFTSLWLSAVEHCRVTAIEQVPLFCWRLKRTARRAGLSLLDVRCGNYLQTSFDGADVIYLYGSNLESSVIVELVQRFSELPDDVKVITVSYPLSDYAVEGLFPLMDRFTAEFEWGQAEVFIQSIR